MCQGHFLFHIPTYIAPPKDTFAGVRFVIFHKKRALPRGVRKWSDESLKYPYGACLL
jgi:hypothetical protein